MRRAVLRHSTRWATTAVAATTLLWLASSAQAMPPVPAYPGGGAAAVLIGGTGLSSPSGPGASHISNLGSGGWKVQSSAAATQTGAQISTPGFSTSTWLPVTNDDAGAPGTEIEALAQNGKCPGDIALQPVNQASDSPHGVFFSANIRRCYGYLHSIGADTIPRFRVPWWWRTDFTPSMRPGQYATLVVNGVIGAASVWMNGHEVAAPRTITGAYTRFSLDITRLLRPGRNSLAIKVNPNNPQAEFTVDDVDWNQVPPDNNTGIQFPVQLAVNGALSDGNSRVVETTPPTSAGPR